MQLISWFHVIIGLPVEKQLLCDIIVLDKFGSWDRSFPVELRCNPNCQTTPQKHFFFCSSETLPSLWMFSFLTGKHSCLTSLPGILRRMLAGFCVHEIEKNFVSHFCWERHGKHQKGWLLFKKLYSFLFCIKGVKWNNFWTETWCANVLTISTCSFNKCAFNFEIIVPSSALQLPSRPSIISILHFAAKLMNKRNDIWVARLLCPVINDKCTNYGKFVHLAS